MDASRSNHFNLVRPNQNGTNFQNRFQSINNTLVDHLYRNPDQSKSCSLFQNSISDLYTDLIKANDNFGGGSFNSCCEIDRYRCSERPGVTSKYRKFREFN
ncbi:MAG: hypothetical protein MHPSP_002690 [Paramarteilia canceri]